MRIPYWGKSYRSQSRGLENPKVVIFGKEWQTIYHTFRKACNENNPSGFFELGLMDQTYILRIRSSPQILLKTHFLHVVLKGFENILFSENLTSVCTKILENIHKYE